MLDSVSEVDEIAEIRRTILKGWVPLLVFAKAVGICQRTAYNFCHEGLPYAKVGAVRYINVERASEWIAARQIAEQPAERLPEPRPVGRPKVQPAKVARERL